jgi:hypothetical protein
MSQKKEFTLEYDFQSSPQLLFQYLSTPSGLSEWFSDDVNYRGEKYTFFGGILRNMLEFYQKNLMKKLDSSGLMVKQMKKIISLNLRFKWMKLQKTFLLLLQTFLKKMKLKKLNYYGIV